GATLVGYLIFIHGVSMTILVSFFVFIVMFGMQIQQVLWFGLFPLLGYHIMGDRLAHSSEMDPMRMQQRIDTIQTNLDRGVGVSQDDMEFFQKHMGQQQMGMGGTPSQSQMMQMRIASGMSG
ncbi:MAG TPA: hypothetical protein VI874_00740, partial [Candidatus Norongarragalinales archaeon]|nr:hypothetical protein [Candidatus Norongarragalinales archaeon]